MAASLIGVVNESKAYEIYLYVCGHNPYIHHMIILDHVCGVLPKNVWERAINLTSQEGHYIINFDSLFTIFIAIAFLGISSSIAVGPSNNNSIDTILSIAVVYAQPSENNNTITAGLGEPFQLQINQTAVIMPDTMSIRLLDMPEDSRCPAFVVCVWPGQVTVSVNVTESSFPSYPRVLNLTLGSSPSNSSSANVDSHIVELLQVEPHPMRDEQIPKNDYRVTLMALPSRPIPIGEWDIVSNGLHGTLNITSIDSKDHLSGTILLYPFDTPPNEVSGYVDGDSGKVTFVRIIGPGPTDFEVYTGYIFTNIIADCLIGTGPGSCYDYARIAGTFESFIGSDDDNNTSTLIGTFGDAKRNTFGWFASHIPQLCPACPR
jgi:hypothetical protein